MGMVAIPNCCVISYTSSNMKEEIALSELLCHIKAFVLVPNFLQEETFPLPRDV